QERGEDRGGHAIDEPRHGVRVTPTVITRNKAFICRLGALTPGLLCVNPWPVAYPCAGRLAHEQSQSVRASSQAWRRGRMPLRGLPTVLWSLRVLTLVAMVAAGLAPVSAATSGLEKINHVIVIYQENRSFDSLYGSFPGADGLANAGDAVKQVGKDGTPYAM